MTDRPILFNGAMVNAILEGSKTQTRRVLKPQPFTAPLAEGESYVSFGEFQANLRNGLLKKVPIVGDHLWVRETWGCHWATDTQKPSEIDPDIWSVRYAADNYIRPAKRDNSCLDLDQVRKNRPSIFMPRWASRLTLVVTDVRVQRIQKISEADAAAEGIIRTPDHIEECSWRGAIDGVDYLDAWAAFSVLWDSINDARGFGWDANPWVVAVTFETHRCNIDQMEARP